MKNIVFALLLGLVFTNCSSNGNKATLSYEEVEIIEVVDTTYELVENEPIFVTLKKDGKTFSGELTEVRN